MKAQGFVRARIDGEVYDLDDTPSIDPKKKHTIEVVVDRFKVRPDIGLRLAESFETALRIADGIAIAVCLDDDPNGNKEHIFSERYACKLCGYSLTELEPRIFSFNNPKGACASCDGLGVKQHFDPELIVHNPELSLAAGAIRGWDKRNGYYFQIISSLAKHYGFDLEQAFAKLPKAIQAMLLYGSGKDTIEFNFLNPAGTAVTRQYAFEGVIANMERRYRGNGFADGARRTG